MLFAGWRNLRHPKRTMPSAAAAPIIGTMTASEVENLDVLVLGGGPAGVVAAVRAARLGARTALITRDALGGIAANDGPSRSARSPTRRA
jgi:NADPH-dependent 2,4-dienoyl-CoA reductase/sulfur reductase-like enzyme